MIRLALFILLTTVLAAVAGATELRVPSIFADHMVVQHSVPFRIWGTAAPGAPVRVQLDAARAEVRAGTDGRWEAELSPPPAGGPYTLTIASDDAQIQIGDVLSGEVWLCSGQSNMEWPLARTAGADAALENADVEGLRLFKMSNRIAHTPMQDAEGAWKVADAATAAGFSAVAWHFGREIAQTQDIPVGLIEAAWGGTYVEAWTPYPVLADFPFMTRALERYQSGRKVASDVGDAERTALSAALESVARLKDSGNRGFPMGWHRPGLDDSDWERIALPKMVEQAASPMDGAFWFRRSVRLPSAWEGRELVLTLGAIDDFDTTYFNGTEIGVTGKDVANAYRTPRTYRIPADLVNGSAREAVIAIRVFDEIGDGGFAGPPSAMGLRPVDAPQSETVSLSGEWRYAVELKAVAPQNGLLAGLVRRTPNQPAVLYNGMIHPIAGYGLRGVLWYQGESNAGRSEAYHSLFPAMIQAWRAAWAQGDFPFYYVQLANFRGLQGMPVEEGWAEIREAQQSALALPNVAEAVILDVGDADDIHPRDKATPAHRLALQARARIYGETVPHNSPYLKQWRVEDGRMVLEFAFTYGELKTRDGSAPEGFALQDSGGNWHWADATLVDGTTIVLSHPEVAEPRAARYAWASNPLGNVVNAAGLPMSGFRTDR